MQVNAFPLFDLSGILQIHRPSLIGEVGRVDTFPLVSQLYLRLLSPLLFLGDRKSVAPPLKMLLSGVKTIHAGDSSVVV